MLSMHTGRFWKGTFDLMFIHHLHGLDMYQSIQENCGICRALFERLQTEIWQSSDGESSLCRTLYKKLKYLTTWPFISQCPLTFRASLSVFGHLYRLDVVLQQLEIRVGCTFILESSGM